MLMRTDPFRDLERLTESVFGNGTRTSLMPMDVYRRGDEFVVRMDLPGIDPESIDLTVEKDVLTVRAERKRPDEDVERIASECSYGKFSRQLSLGDALDTENVTADYTDGVLTLHLPIAEEAKPRRIEVQRGSTVRRPELAQAS